MSDKYRKSYKWLQMQNSSVYTIKAEKAFEKIQHVFTINTLESIGRGGIKLQCD